MATGCGGPPGGIPRPSSWAASGKSRGSSRSSAAQIQPEPGANDRSASWVHLVEPGRQPEAFHDAGQGAVQNLLQPERPVDRQRHGVQRLQLPVPTHQLEAHAPDAEEHLDPRDQLVRVERLGDVIVGADFQAHDHVPGGILGGQHDHRDVTPLLVGLQAAAHLVPIHPRHHHVQQD
jgi:hypothetical protein